MNGKGDDSNPFPLDSGSKCMLYHNCIQRIISKSGVWVTYLPEWPCFWNGQRIRTLSVEQNKGNNVMKTHDGSILVFYDAASHAKGLSSHALLRGLSKAAGSPGEEKIRWFLQCGWWLPLPSTLKDPKGRELNSNDDFWKIRAHLINCERMPLLSSLYCHTLVADYCSHYGCCNTIKLTSENNIPRL